MDNNLMDVEMLHCRWYFAVWYGRRADAEALWIEYQRAKEAEHDRLLASAVI